MVRLKAESARPELCSLDRRGVDGELLRLGVVHSRGLKACDVGSVTQLSLRVAANDVQVVSLWQVVCLLLVARQVFERICKHALVQGN